MIIHQAGWATIYQAHAGTVDGVVFGDMGSRCLRHHQGSAAVRGTSFETTYCYAQHENQNDLYLLLAMACKHQDLFRVAIAMVFPTETLEPFHDHFPGQSPKIRLVAVFGMQLYSLSIW